MTLGERIRKIRKALDLTQQKFANEIGSTQNALTCYETGRRNPSSSVINNICKSFNVSEKWLRTEDGEMFIPQSETDELTAAVERLITGESADFKRRLVDVLSSLKDEHWGIIEDKLKEIIGTKSHMPEQNPTHDNLIQKEPQLQKAQESEIFELKSHIQELENEKEDLRREMTEMKEQLAAIMQEDQEDMEQVNQTISGGTRSL